MLSGADNMAPYCLVVASDVVNMAPPALKLTHVTENYLGNMNE
jgi:hypothetical protein